jgi:hypothetical protein
MHHLFCMLTSLSLLLLCLQEDNCARLMAASLFGKVHAVAMTCCDAHILSARSPICYVCYLFVVQEIELDCARLLATGLFGKARPAAMTAGRGEAPQFGAVKPDTGVEDESQPDAAAAAGVTTTDYTGDVALQLVPPLGSLKFIVEPRKLPLVSSVEVRLDSSLKDAGVDTVQLQGIASSLLEAAAAEAKAKAAAAAPAADEKKEEGKDDQEEKEKEKEADTDSSLKLYLQLRAQLAAAYPQPEQIVVAFSGVETGRVEVLVRARRAADPAYVSGLEGTAEGGEGLGIDSFKPQRTSVQLSPGMLLPAEAAERLAAARAARQAERVLPPPAGWERRWGCVSWFSGYLLSIAWVVLGCLVLIMWCMPNTAAS